MSSEIIFKKLSDVAIADSVTDAANILVEENGEIKKVAKTEVGGNGAKTDLILRVDGYISNENEEDYSKISIVEGTVYDVFQVVRNGGIPKAKVRFYDSTDDSFSPTREEYDAQTYIYGELLYVACVNFNMYGAGAYITRIIFDSSGIVQHLRIKDIRADN